MTHQKVYKQGRYDKKVKVNIQSPLPASFSHESSVVYKDVGIGLCISTFAFISYLPCLRCIIPTLFYISNVNFHVDVSSNIHRFF